MKKLIFLLVLTGCINADPKIPNEPPKNTIGDLNIRVIDGCEYLEFSAGINEYKVYSLTHKGNCKNHNGGTDEPNKK